MPKKKKIGLSRERAVFEVIHNTRSTLVEASSTAELKEALTPLLPALGPYVVQGLAVAAVEARATLKAETWSIQRKGVLRFEADPIADTLSDRRTSKKRPDKDKKSQPDAPAPASESEAENETLPDETQP